MHKLVHCSLLALGAAGMMFAQDIVSLKQGGGPSRTPIPPADAAVLSSIQIARMPNGSWRCTGKTGACSAPEVQTIARLTVREKAASGVKKTLQTQVLVVAPDGTISCKDSTNGRPCTDVEVNDFASSLKTRHDTVKNSINNVR